MTKVRTIVVTLLFILFVTGAAIPGIYFYTKYRSVQKQVLGIGVMPEIQKDVDTQKKEIIEKVSKHFLLPENEMPEVLTITEPEKLAGQEFFVKAKSGDILLVYYAAKKAFLYDPELDKILEVGPVTVNNTPTPTQSVQIEPTRTQIVISPTIMASPSAETVQ